MKKNIGIVRTVDSLGRFFVPSELRQSMGVIPGDSIVFFYDEEQKQIMIRAYRVQECLFCRSIKKLNKFRDQLICAECLQDIIEQKQVNNGAN